MPRDVRLSDGTTRRACRLEVWDDLASEAPRAYRLFWVVPGETTGCPAVGLCEVGGSHRTIKAAIADGRRRFGETAVRT